MTAHRPGPPDRGPDHDHDPGPDREADPGHPTAPRPETHPDAGTVPTSHILGDARRPRRRGELRSVRTAMVVSAADQGVAALTNIAVVIMAARQSTAEAFASFAVVYTGFAVILGFATAYVGQALVLRRAPPPRLHAHCRSAALFTLVSATALGLALALCALWFPGELADALLALGLVLPLVLSQDGLRYGFALLGRAHHALAADSLRLLTVVPALAVQPSGSSGARLIAVWGVSVLPALLLGGWLLLRTTRGAGLTPLTEPLRRGYLGRRFAVEFGVGNAGTQLAVIGLGLFASPLAVGALRGATTLFGPMNVLYNAANGFGPPQLNRLAADGNKARAAGYTGLALAVVAAGWGLLLMLLPDSWGRQLLGDTWDSAAALLPATASQYAVMALGVCGLLTLRVTAPRATLRIQVVFSLLSVALLIGGYALGGVMGAAWGLCVGSAAKAVAAWLRVRTVLRPPPAGPGPAAVTPAADAGPRGTS